MSRDEIKAVAVSKVAALQTKSPLDAAAVGKLTGMIMKELAGKADGSDVKAVLEELVNKTVL